MIFDFEQYMKDKIARVIRDGESHQEQFCICPCCGYAQDEIYVESEDVEQQQECESCEKTFVMRVKTVYSTRVLK